VTKPYSFLSGVPEFVRDHSAWIWLKRNPLLSGFDAAFYRNQYPDLRFLNTTRDLARHYIRHGVEEGRIKNPSEAIRSAEQRHGKLPADFDVHLYRILNEDLGYIFKHDWQFALHYLEHGRQEGRPYGARRYETADLTDQANSTLDLNGVWPHLFCLPEFVAYSHDWLSEEPATVLDGLRVFLHQGVERLAPLRFESIFDPSFYRAAYPVDRGSSDPELYRHWLRTGVLKGWAPNEQGAINPFVGDKDFPECFDWRRYRSGLLPRGFRHRVDCLRHFFERGFRRGNSKHISGNGSAELFAAVGRYHLIRGHHKNALYALDRAIDRGLSSSNVFRLRGETYLALGNEAAAQADFSKAASFSNASLPAHVHGIRTAATLGNFDVAFECIAHASGRWVKSAPFRMVQREALESFFTAESRVALNLYHEGKRAEADTRLLSAVERIAREVAAEGLPTHVGPKQDGHIAILANIDLVQCRHYRVEQKVLQLEAAGIAARICNFHHAELFPEFLLGARAAVFYRLPAFPGVVRAILTAKALGIPTFYDIDDLIFSNEHFPDSFESYEGQISRQTYEALMYDVPLHRFAMSLCDYGIASTTPLRHEMQRVLGGRACYVLRNSLDMRNKKIIELGVSFRPKKRTVSIFYGSATKAHNRDFNDIIGPALLAALKKHDNVRLVIAGHLRLSSVFDIYQTRINWLEFTPNLDQYWAAMAAADINLSVLAPGAVADSKSEIKWLEAAILQIPSVVSDTATYREVIEHGVDGLIAGDAASWSAALDLLISDSDLRHQMGAAARRKALDRYSLECSSQELCQILGIEAPRIEGCHSDKMSASPQSHARKPRILICNVFFPPQLYGGATRVVRDNVDYILDNAPDIELSVFTTDEGISPAGQFRFDQYRGIPVFRVSTPVKPLMDWEPFNPDNEEFFERVLDLVQPDLVHFHCIQRLTASIVEVAQRRGIPYLITAHDAWWISDHQFLVDEHGVLRLPSLDYFDDVPPQAITGVASVARRQRLGDLLASAVHVLAVSESFADIYRRAGCSNVLTVENGVSAIAPLPRQVGKKGYLSLGHIGGRSAHKGATLIEAIFRTTQFRNLRLTIVDATIESGSQREVVWGTTPVILCGHYPQEQVAELYASLDVLLAPSIWPESFGLVAREALVHGLWVVASDRGAMGEGIRDGVNGFVVDVASPRDLLRVLRMMDDDIARFSESPPLDTEQAMRTAADQSAELADLYRSILRGIVAATDASHPLAIAHEST